MADTALSRAAAQRSLPHKGGGLFASVRHQPSPFMGEGAERKLGGRG
jgi:hypothetical protein